jgi:hypothetical protein
VCACTYNTCTGSRLHKLPLDEPASFTTLRTKGGWLVSASKEGGVISGVVIEATVPGTVRLVPPWANVADAEAVTVACSPAPASPAVTTTSVANREGLVTWAMAAGQACAISK